MWKEVKLGNYKQRNANTTDERLNRTFTSSHDTSKPNHQMQESGLETEINSNIEVERESEKQYYRKLLVSNSSLPPAAIISIQSMLEDEREVPLYKEKIPYIVVFGEPGVFS